MSDPALPAAIGAALGLDGPYSASPAPGGEGISASAMREAQSGAVRKVPAGTVEPGTGRAAWVEQVSGAPRGGVFRRGATFRSN